MLCLILLTLLETTICVHSNALVEFNVFQSNLALPSKYSNGGFMLDFLYTTIFIENQTCLQPLW